MTSLRDGGCLFWWPTRDAAFPSSWWRSIGGWVTTVTESKLCTNLLLLLLTFVLIPRLQHGSFLAGAELVLIIHRCRTHTAAIVRRSEAAPSVCHRSSLIILPVAVDKTNGTGGQSKLLHRRWWMWKEQTFLTQNKCEVFLTSFFHHGRSPYKSREEVQGSHLCVDRLARTRSCEDPIQKTSGVLFWTSSSSREYGMGRYFLFIGLNVEKVTSSFNIL